MQAIGLALSVGLGRCKSIDLDVRGCRETGENSAE